MLKILSRLAPVFLLLAATMASTATAEDRAHTISLNSGKIDVRQEFSTAPEHLKRFAGEAGSEIQLVKFPGPVSAEQLRQLEAQVEQVYTYLPHDTFLVKVSPDKAQLEPVTLGASWMGIYHPAYKISPSVAAMAAEAITSEDGEKARRKKSLMLHVYPDVDLKKLSQKLSRLGFGKVVGQNQRQRFSRLRLLLSPGQIAEAREQLALFPEIFWLDLEPRRTLLNDTTVWVAQSGTSGGQATPVYDAGIVGQGQIVGVLDTGIDPDMCYFRDTTLGLPPQNPCNGGTVVNNNQRKVIGVDFLWANECSGGISANEWDTQDHGTHVAGTVAGDNFANPLSHDPGDGLAPGAKLVIQDCGFQTDNCADCPGIGACPVVDLNPVFQQAYDQGARIHTNSWGDDENNPVQGLYSAGSEDADEFMWNNKDFLLVFAAGNSGPGTTTVGSPSTAKSVVSVGATLRGSSANSMASFSSCGPTDDGRIKPDITMPGSGIISANSDNNINSNNCNTKSSSGTSMAAPGVAGSLALIREYFTDGFYPSGSANAGDALTPSGALLKATLMNSGRNMTGTTAIPSNCQGWGRVLLDDALHFSGDSRLLFVEDDATGFSGGSSGENRDFTINVTSSSESLKATLAWADYPSTPAANPHINNDLDLTVIGPGGVTTWRGNVFSGGVSTTGGSADRLTSVEQVLLANPAVGAYTIRVSSFTVPNGPQPFALVVSGDINTCSPPPIANAGADRAITVGDSTTLGASAQTGNSYSWSPGGATTAQITVSPTTTTTYTVTATTSCGSVQDSVTVTVNPVGGCNDCVDFSTTGTVSYSNQDVSGNATVEDGGDTLLLQNNTWRRTSQTYTITANTVLEVDFSSATQGEIHGIGFDEDDTLTNNVRIFQLHGTQNWGSANHDFDNYAGGGAFTTYTIPVGQYYTGTMYLVLVNDNDAGSGNDSRFKNVRIYEDVPTGGTCAVDEDFQSGATGWTNSGSCSTGSFVVGTPTSVVNGGVTTQLAGDHTTGSGNAFFSAVNTSAGSNDVDGGTCIVESPTYTVNDASDVSLWYFHGQRDAGDDSGDFFRLEISTNGGTSYTTLASFGDVTVNAAWTEATTTVAAGTSVKFRLQVADGTSGGDLIEAGLDDVSICPQ